MHLPIAPKCNIQCNYCVRKFDCSLTRASRRDHRNSFPGSGFEKYKLVKEKVPNLTVVGIAGPGDALANFDETRKALTLIHEYDPNVTFCVSTNGLMLPYYAKELASLGFPTSRSRSMRLIRPLVPKSTNIGILWGTVNMAKPVPQFC